MTCTGLFLTYSLVRPKHGPGDNAHVTQRFVDTVSRLS